MAYTLAGNTLPNVQREIINKNSNILVIPKPRDEADATYTFDFLGVTTRIVVEGTVVGSTNIDTFITTFLGTKNNLSGTLIDGSQASVQYTGSHGIGVPGAPPNDDFLWVKVLDVKVNSVATETEEIMKYSINMIQGLQ